MHLRLTRDSLSLTNFFLRKTLWIICAWASNLGAQTVVINPPMPTATDIISVSAYFFGGPFVGTHSQSMTAGTVSIQMVRDGVDLGPNPPFYFTESVGPLAPGTYQFKTTIYSPIDPQAALTADTTIVVTPSPPVTILSAVEFYHSSFDHYFLSASATEIQALDSGVHSGWMRTGLSFKVYQSSVPDTAPVCRFYIPPDKGDSHFFSAYENECRTVELGLLIGQPTYAGYIKEASNIFYLKQPSSDGSCPVGFSPVYRLWNGRTDSNHRYTTDTSVKAQMVKRGYIAEGWGQNAVAMCSPNY